MPSSSSSEYVISRIDLPNGQSYHFYYGTDNPDSTLNNPYGLLSEIVYPSGAWIKYKWKLSDTLSAYDEWQSGPIVNANGQGGGVTFATCGVSYSEPVVSSRTVGLANSSTPILDQEFTYWTLNAGAIGQISPISPVPSYKQTDIIQTDAVSGQSDHKRFVYQGVAPPRNAFFLTPSYVYAVPAEQVSYVYPGTSSSPIATTYKGFDPLSELVCSFQQRDDGLSIGHIYQYQSGYLTDDKQYGYGGIADPAAACAGQVPTGVVPDRETQASYQSTVSPLGISFNRMTDNSVFSNGTLASETTYAYDESPVVAVSGLPTGTHDETFYGTNQTAGRGNLTTKTEKCFPTCQDIAEAFTYDTTGNVRSRITASGTYAFDYTDSPVGGNPAGDSNGYITKYTRPSTNGITHVSTAKYDYSIGRVIERHDENAGVFTYTYNDTLHRLTDIYAPPSQDNGGARPHTQYSYTDGITPTVTTTGPTGTISIQVYDGLERLQQTQLASDPVGVVKVDNFYDGKSQLVAQSNPYRTQAEQTYGGVSFAYDVLGRKSMQCQQDNASSFITSCVAGNSYQSWSYSGPVTTFMDETGISHQSVADNLGRLYEVREPDPTGSALLYTNYTYNGSDDLTGVVQHGSGSETARTRSFQYDSLSRLVTSTNPETGTICYGQWSSGNCQGGYDANGNLHYKTDARGVTITYSYDALNRLTFKLYPSGTYTAGFGYDGNNEYGTPLSNFGLTSANAVGRLSLASNQVNAAQVFSYDSMGRVVSQNQFLPSANAWGTLVSAKYDLAGNTTDLTYPDGRHIQQCFDSAGRLTSSGLYSGGTCPSQDYVQSVTYLPDGSPHVLTLGNGVQQTTEKNNRLQVQSMSASSPFAPFNSQPFVSHTYSYVNPQSTAAGNNGNIYGISDTLNGTRSQGFTYDALNRIGSFSLGGAVNQQYQIDSFGNMTPIIRTGQNPPFALYSFDPATNRINNLPCASAVSAYDAAGNQLCSTDQYSGISQYSYDAESRISEINALNSGSPFVSYLYDADGARVRKSNADGTFTEYVYFGGKVISERDDAEQWTDYVFAGGSRIARLRAEDVWLATSGTQPSTPVASSWTLPTPTNGSGGAYTVKANDQFCVRQYNTNAVVSGPFVTFSNGVSTDATWIASDGAPLGALTGGWPVWAERCADLSHSGGTTGASITSLGVTTSAQTPAGLTGFYSLYADMAIVSRDGTVTPITLSVTSGPQTSTASAYTAYPWMDNSDNAPQSTHYFLADHLGTAQLELAEGGWPVYSGQFAPYGGELLNGSPLTPGQPDGSSSNYKFTGKERDSESGLDYFGARYYTSNMGRFMSPDWSAGPQAVPYADLSDPQSLNLYGYVRNNPLSRADPNGHWCILGHGTTCTTVPPPPAPPAPKPPAVVTPGTPQYNLAAAQAAARSNPKFQPQGTPGQPDRKTFCNISVCAIVKATGGATDGIVNAQGQPNLANTDVKTLADSSAYQVGTPQQAQDAANAGQIAIGVISETGHGHIVTTAPELIPGTQDVGKFGPLVNNIGASVGITNANNVFRNPNNQPTWYVPVPPQ